MGNHLNAAQGNPGAAIGLGVVAGTGTLAVGSMFTYFTCQNLGLWGWDGPIGMATVIGTGAGAIVAAKVSSNMSHRRAIERAHQARQQLIASFPAELQHAVDLLTNRWQACLMWTHPQIAIGRAPNPRIVGDEGVCPVLLAGQDPGYLPDPGVRESPVGLRVRLGLPQGFSADHVRARLTTIASSLAVPQAQVVEVRSNVIVLELRVRDLPVDREWLNGFEPRLHPVLTRLRDPWQACELWSSLKLGRKPGPGEPGAWPRLVPSAGVDVPDDGICWTPVGARVRVQLPDNVSPLDIRDKSDKVASAMDVWKFRVHDVDGNKARLDLYVRDTISEVIDSPLILPLQEAGPDGIHRIRYAPAVEAGSRSCYDDVLWGISEFGDPVVGNFFSGGHRAGQGETRSGKSVTLYTMILASLLMRDTVTVIIDPNAATVAPFWQCADHVCDSQDPKDAMGTLDIVLAEMERRKKLFARMRSDRFSEFSEEVPLWNIFIDENSNYTHDKKYNEKLKKVAKQVAKFGGRITLADQKLDHESLSTAIRINLFDRICHRVSSREDFDHLLAGLPDLAKEAANVEEPMAQGVAIVRLSTHERPVRMRVHYLPSAALYDIGDQLTAELGAKRPPMWEDQDAPFPGQPAAAPAGTDDANVVALRPAAAGQSDQDDLSPEDKAVIEQIEATGGKVARCRYCNRKIAPLSGGGRPAQFCRPDTGRNCRQNWHRHMKRTAQGGN